MDGVTAVGDRLVIHTLVHGSAPDGCLRHSNGISLLCLEIARPVCAALRELSGNFCHGLVVVLVSRADAVAVPPDLRAMLARMNKGAAPAIAVGSAPAAFLDLAIRARNSAGPAMH